jgi:hypothetical protein
LLVSPMAKLTVPVGSALPKSPSGKELNRLNRM